MLNFDFQLSHTMENKLLRMLLTFIQIGLIILIVLLFSVVAFPFKLSLVQTETKSEISTPENKGYALEQIAIIKQQHITIQKVNSIKYNSILTNKQHAEKPVKRFS